MMADPRFHLGNEKHLFLDQTLFREAHGIALTVNPPVRAELVLEPDRPWETKLHPYSNILKDGDLVKMWYVASGKKVACYAESTDGINWERPNLGLFDWEGSRENNIVMLGGRPFVTIDPTADSSERFKALASVSEDPAWGETKGCIGGSYTQDPESGEWSELDYQKGGKPFKKLYFCSSPDGLRWKIHQPAALPFFHDSHNQLEFDERIQKYVAYVRWHQHGRAVARTEFTDPHDLPWPFVENPAAERGPDDSLRQIGDELQVVMSTDETDPVASDLYTPCVHRYPWAKDAYLSFTTLYRHYTEGRNDGPVDVQLATSRDGISFARPDRRPYVPLGLSESAEGGQVYMLHGMIRNGNEIYQYCSGTNGVHGRVREDEPWSFRRLVQRLDGFISADAAYTGGEFTTYPLTFTGDELHLNVDCSAAGQVRVEIRDEMNHPFQGHTLADCDGVDRNQTDATMTWSGSSDLRHLTGRTVTLHFVMRSCKLFAIRFPSS